jgi:Ca2+-binding RTX toxin-like protein
MKKELLRIAVAALAVIAVTTWAIQTDRFWVAGTAFAVGDLTINWGVPEGSPIFTITNFAPGQTVSRNVNVTNNASTARSLGVKGVVTATDPLSDQLNIVISANGTPLYGTDSSTGQKTLTNFFTDSAAPTGIPLLMLQPGGNTTLTFSVAFNDDATNTVQGASVTFDITLGIAIDVPAACAGISLSGAPIFGTERGDAIRGTTGNDLIFAFEGGDSVRGLGGDDCIVGGAGADTLRGGNGNDIILGEAGGDSLNGENGNDTLDGGADSDGLRGGNGEDILAGGDGSDSLRGENGNDQLDGGAGSDNLRGGNGNDLIRGGAGDDGMQGENGNDELDGGLGTDGADGGSGVDRCVAETRRRCET